MMRVALFACFVTVSAAFGQGTTPPTSEIQGDQVYRIYNVNSGLALDVIEGSKLSGAELVQVKPNPKAKSQQWKVMNADTGVYKLVNMNSRHAVDLPYGELRRGVPLIQWQEHGEENQQWVIKKLTQGYLIASRKSNLAVTVVDGSKKPGARVIQTVYYGVKAQLWKFEPVTEK